VEANLKRRVVTALLLVPLLIYVVRWAPLSVFTAVVFGVACLGLYEFFGMAFPGRSAEQALGIFVGLAVAAFLTFLEAVSAALGFSVLIVTTFAIYLFLPGSPREIVTRIGWLLIGAGYVGLLLPHWILLLRVAGGRHWVVFVLAVILTGDTVAYVVGRRWGRKKLAPGISPGKTWVGAWGYMSGGMVAGAVLGYILLKPRGFAEILVLSGFLALLGQIGDLFESLLKRAFNVKDSGALLPGHGGVLDRLDSLMFPAVFIYAYLKVFHP
jgi:phosphatidate cytidylyltransferase